MPIYEVPVTLIEYGRVARVEAENRKEAAAKARAGTWLEAGDPDSYVVKVTGAIVRVEEIRKVVG